MTVFITDDLTANRNQATPKLQGNFALESLSARIENLPEDLRVVVAARREGIASKLNATLERVEQGLQQTLSIAVQSAYGEIVLHTDVPQGVKPEAFQASLPQIGAKVQLEISPQILGNPDTPVTFHYTPSSTPDAPLTRNTETPIDVRVDAPPPELSLGRVTLPEAPVRLRPISTQEAVQYIAATPVPRDIPAQMTALPAPAPIIHDAPDTPITVRKAVVEALPRYNSIALPQAVPVRAQEIAPSAPPPVQTTIAPRVFAAATLPPVPVPSQGEESLTTAHAIHSKTTQAQVIDSAPPLPALRAVQEPAAIAGQVRVPDAPIQIHAQIEPQYAISRPVEIVAKTPQGFPVVQMEQSLPPSSSTNAQPAITQQHFILQAPAPELPIGSRLELVPQNVGAESAQTLTNLPTTALPQWPVMAEIAQVLQSLTQSPSPETAAMAQQAVQSLAAAMPAPSSPAQFGAATLFFVAAVRGGDLSSWLGEKTVELLRREGHGNLLTRLTGETPAMARTEGAGQDWRALSIPLYYDGEIYKAALHYKHEHESEGDEAIGGIKATRFVFDLKFNSVGKVQLDGYFKAPNTSSDKRLDLILRSEQHFSTRMHQEMRGLYSTALRAAGVTGELSFQNAAQGWVTIEAAKAGSLGVEA
ncbi:MAG: hypothetical protein ACRBCT_08830 [Alphaproteobacteria bacterium]